MKNETRIVVSATQRVPQLHAIFAIALIAQVAFWHFASPGPFLRTGELNIGSACRSAVASFLCLFLIPWIGAILLGIKPANSELGIGQWRKGLLIVGLGVPIVAVGLFVGSGDPEIQAAYPWPGKWLSDSIGNMLMWFAVYAIYYFAFEYFYRSFLLFRLEKELGLAAAIWIHVLMSVAVHFGKPTPELLASIPAGFAFGLIAWHTKSIWYVFAIHWGIGILNDVFAMHHHGWLDS
ncbi:type II CAAX endopeptidase family protein [Mariniblastus fucicola]|uniref:CAAX amino terminal protease self-immunity n=1 Tax=Mariniblastus fucicola TaxID=980251 RepID=A0A5B9PE79_9BACT|nr:type II CAAX endopeptidase family protein [Mariniblastus fucicola]QEG23460.1 CAAX amino terminal protease self- immunity [Mariniblastus fucicola]